jgi:hypothetical protein
MRKTLLVGILSVSAALLSCQTEPKVIVGVPSHCETLKEWHESKPVARNRRRLRRLVVHLRESEAHREAAADLFGMSVGDLELLSIEILYHLDRDDYLEARCHGINAFRDEGRWWKP